MGERFWGQRLRWMLLTGGLLVTSGTLRPVVADTITIDEYLYENNSANDPYLGELNASLDITQTGNVLTVVLRNTQTSNKGQDAGNIITGLAFNLPVGVRVDCSISQVEIAPGSSLVGTPSTNASNNLQDQWGVTHLGEKSGHFDTVTRLAPTTLRLSTMNADTWTSFSGIAPATNQLMDSFDYGLKSASGAGSSKIAVEDTLIFTLGLTGMDATADLLATIRQGPVVIAYGSPQLSSLGAAGAPLEAAAVPEPSSLLTLAGLGLTGLILAVRRRRRSPGPAS